MSRADASTFKVALIQMRSGLEPQPNLAAVLTGIDEAKRGGADYVLTPEMTNVLENKRERLFTKIVSDEHDTTLATLREVARKLSLYIHIGSLAIKASPEKAANRSFLIDRKGDVVARYDKIHMFDVDLADGESYRESSSYRAGELAVVADLPWGRLGLSVCYDLRFPALYRALAEAGKHEHGRETFGHSLVVDPWGKIIAEGGTEPGVIFADIDPEQVAAARGRVPSLLHGRRFELVEPMAEPTYLHAVRGSP